MSEFKIGDRVRVVADQCFHGHPMGSEGLVNLVEENHYKMAGSNMWFFESDLELISESTPTSTESETAEEPVVELKVGDRVRVLTNRGQMKFGAESVVIRVTDAGNYDLKGEQVAYYRREELEFISRPTPVPISEEPSVTPESIYHQLAVEIADLVTVKQIKYGDSFNKSGEVLRILYPDGVTPDKYDDFLAVTRLLDKLFRIATDRDALGESPWRDINGYSLLSIARVERERTAKSN